MGNFIFWAVIVAGFSENIKKKSDMRSLFRKNLN